ncbi:tetratricopeptide repeat protein 33 [Microcaecilia unicolor]|uniref:Tetratricopeptide repeat protein 33 n=1 Tax=Microcaecilia unicolor TaxID=1415580 RepID=A0A6P7XD09_9AMPH|nr:tetratricopeptide repeat protein 33 [Microcaecilia unicolor]XP_030048045.1 tetratricopeptide repeat protein 33 [Microcaecilia unicolor]
MASFGWKRKAGEKVSKSVSQQFEADAADDEGLIDTEEGDWLHAIKRKKEIPPEDNIIKSKRLKDEGTCLAENGRYWEAIHKWDEALHLTPEDATLYEMKSQVLISLQEVFPAVQTAELAVQRDPHYWEAWQTLGRAQLGLGEITLAIRSFQVALHICPMNSELWKEDLAWARQLLEKQREAKKRENSEAQLTGTENIQEKIPDYDFESDEVVAACAAIAQKQKMASTDEIVVVSASGTVETITEKKSNATTPDDKMFVKARGF